MEISYNISAKQAEIERNVFSAFNLFLGGMDVFKGKEVYNKFIWFQLR